MSKLALIFKSNEKHPLLLQYPNETQPQRAYIELDLKHNTLDACVFPELGHGGCTVSSHNGTTVEWQLNPYITKRDLMAIFKDNMGYFQDIFDRSTCEWDNENWVGTSPDIEYTRFID